MNKNLLNIVHLIFKQNKLFQKSTFKSHIFMKMKTIIERMIYPSKIER